MPYFGGYFGGSGGSCDYPAEGDVRLGVNYGSGAYTGTLSVPTLGVDADSHSPADVVRWLLVLMGLGSAPGGGDWPVFAAGEPDLPDNCITVYDTQGTDDGRSQIDGELFSHEGIQVRVRARTHPEGWVKAHAIREALAKQAYDETVVTGGEAYLVHSINRIGNVIALGKEVPSTKRSLFTINATVSLRHL